MRAEAIELVARPEDAISEPHARDAAADCDRLLDTLASADPAVPPEVRATLRRLRRAVLATDARLADQAARIAYLESLSVTDELTGLMNRRGFDREIDKTLARAARTGETGLLVLCDLDHFKPINDTYGHQAGDAVLFAVAQLLHQGARTTDATARLGGDEFAVLLTNAAPPAAQLRIARLREKLGRLVVDCAEERVPVSASFGHAVYGPNSDATTLLRLADRALYRAKAEGPLVRGDRGD